MQLIWHSLAPRANCCAAWSDGGADDAQQHDICRAVSAQTRSARRRPAFQRTRMRAREAAPLLYRGRPAPEPSRRDAVRCTKYSTARHEGHLSPGLHVSYPTGAFAGKSKVCALLAICMADTTPTRAFCKQPTPPHIALSERRGRQDPIVAYRCSFGESLENQISNEVTRCSPMPPRARQSTVATVVSSPNQKDQDKRPT